MSRHMQLRRVSDEARGHGQMLEQKQPNLLAIAARHDPMSPKTGPPPTLQSCPNPVCEVNLKSEADLHYTAPEAGPAVRAWQSAAGC
eukprot:747937-Hanusia_phi.AAC.1